MVLRAEPSKGGARILTIPFKAIIDIIEIDDRDANLSCWFKVKHNGSTGWISGSYLDFDIAEKPEIHKVRGTFKRIEMGDYYHLVMKNDSGKEVSYWLYKQVENIDIFKLIPKQSEYAGRPVRVSWRECMVFIPKAGSIERIQMTVKIEFFDK